MHIIHSVHPTDFEQYNTTQIRERFLLENLVVANTVNYVYTHYDRMITGAAFPLQQAVALHTAEGLKANYFLERREIGIINISNEGSITVDGILHTMQRLDCLYIGKGCKEILFNTLHENGSKFIFFSCPAHQSYPVQYMPATNATPAEMGSSATANHRVINKYIHADGLQSCQLMLGVTSFKEGSIWNTMPPHLHDRRMETYFYFDVPQNQRVVHFMGQPHETRHLFIENEQAVVSPSWSIHSGVGTASYSFIWAMAGENISFTDMDAVPIDTLK
jgi:4-deoxy-L-threo-5-hexosulose-uronate ketol-isomerase